MVGFIVKREHLAVLFQNRVNNPALYSDAAAVDNANLTISFR
jgi:hypothetical protein